MGGGPTAGPTPSLLGLIVHEPWVGLADGRQVGLPAGGCRRRGRRQGVQRRPVEDGGRLAAQ
eukprot:8853041-Lingulodinium_polyedra.AAC.1